ncbi:MAG: hypothetical protein HKN91_06510 [Acidimicrobiia bacterium]|nr:hypothetical protein [Acidimicrobiia bacterium]
MQVTIHIGTYKTATSAIQWGLARSSKILGRVGAKYAATGLNVPLSKHLHLFDHIVDGGYNHDRHLTHKGEDYLAGLRAELEEPGVSHLLISEEELSYPTTTIADYLAPLADKAAVEVVMVVRRQPEFLESLYLQFLKEPLRQLTDTFEEFLESRYADYADFASVLEPWEAAFGRDALTVIDFDELRKGDVVANFADQLGLPKGLKAPDHVINPSITPAAGELLRQIASNTPNFPRMALAGMLRQIEPGKGTSLLTPELHDRILDQYRDSNQRLADGYGVKLDRQQENSRRVVTSEEIEADALAAAAQVIGVMWRRTKRAANSIQKMSDDQQTALDNIRGMLRAGDDVSRKR